jgi:hypothetical protein
MHIPLVTAGFWLIWRQPAETPPARRLIIAWSLPLLGLFTLAGLSNTPVVIWLTLLLPIILGITATRLNAQVDEIRAIVRRAFMFSRPQFWQSHWLTTPITSLGLALREAASILEGENGLLWLLAFVVILLLVRS